MARKASPLVRQGFKFFVIFALGIYVLDWLIFAIRVQNQTAYSTVQVDQFLATPLKGQKEEFDFLGTQAQSCVRAIFPHPSNPPCWWVERHKTQWEQ